jgi:hypothetical protein
MRPPRECYQMERTSAARFPGRRPGQHRGLAPWAEGTIRAGRAGQTAVIAALPFIGPLPPLGGRG